MSMSKNTRETLFTVAYIVLGLAGALLAGWLTARGRFFTTPRPLIDFVVIGFFGSLAYAVIQMRGGGYAILLLVLMYLVQLAMAGPIRALRAGAFISAALILPVSFALIGSAFAMKKFSRRSSQSSFAPFS